MKSKKYTRKTPRLFTHLQKQTCPLGYFKAQDDLFHAYVDWLDYYDPIGFLRNWGVRREYEPEAADLALNVQRCQNVDEFAAELHQCFITWFDEQDLKPHFLRLGFHAAAQDGWALWRRFQFDMRKQPMWVVEQEKLAQFRSPAFHDQDRLYFHQLVNVEGVDCLFQRRLNHSATLDFMAADAADWSDAQIIEKARGTGLIREASDVHVQHDNPEFVTVVFESASSPYPAVKT